MIRTAAAIAIAVSLAYGPAAQATAPQPPDISHVVRIEGPLPHWNPSRAHGMTVLMDDGTNVLYPRLRHMQWQCNREHGVNTEAAAHCRAEWKAAYAALLRMR